MKYGDKRNYPKIDIYIQGKYIATTTWAKTCREALERYIEKRGFSEGIKCRFQGR